MDEPEQTSLSSLPAQQLLEELESFIILEFKRNGTLWTGVDKFSNFFYEKYGVTPEEVARVQGGSLNLRSFLRSSGRFSIYAQVPHQVYVALLETIVPSSPGVQPSSTPDEIKRSCKNAEHWIGRMKTEGGEEILPNQCLDFLEEQPILVSEIKSTDDLKIALLEIVKNLTGNNSRKFVSIGALSKEFFNCYQQPIRTMMRRVCPDIKLLNLLQSMTILNVQKVDDAWQVGIVS